MKYATPAQINKALALMAENGHRTDFMCASHQALGAHEDELRGRVDDWLRRQSVADVSGIIDMLIDEDEESL